VSAPEKTTMPPVLATTPVVALGELMGALHRRDPLTAKHCGAVARYAQAIAFQLGLPRADVDLVYLAAVMHDVGKIFLPDHILKGTGRLSESDWELVRQHPERGAWLVAEVHPGPLAEVVLDHHERIDGSGYPNRLAGEEVSIHARIISVADTFDAMTSRESYRSPVSTAEAIAELRRVAGTQLDRKAVKAMIKVAERKMPQAA